MTSACSPSTSSHGGIRVVVDLERQPAAFDAVAVPGVVEDLAAVEAAEEIVDVGADKLLIEQERLLARQLLGREARSVRQLECHLLPLVGDRHLGLDDAAARNRGRIEDRRRTAWHAGRHGRRRAPGQGRADLFRLREADEHLVDDRVDAAAADRVVRRVLDHLVPGQVQKRPRPRIGGDMEGGEWLGIPLQAALGAPGRLLDVDAGAGDAHEHVGTRAGSHLPAPAGVGIGQRS